MDTINSDALITEEVSEMKVVNLHECVFECQTLICF